MACAPCTHTLVIGLVAWHLLLVGAAAAMVCVYVAALQSQGYNVCPMVFTSLLFVVPGALLLWQGSVCIATLTFMLATTSLLYHSTHGATMRKFDVVMCGSTGSIGVLQMTMLMEQRGVSLLPALAVLLALGTPVMCNLPSMKRSLGCRAGCCSGDAAPQLELAGTTDEALKKEHRDASSAPPTTEDLDDVLTLCEHLTMHLMAIVALMLVAMAHGEGEMADALKAAAARSF